ncbi:cytochrome c-type biogenesis protein CcmH [Tropicibacter naphthalenivorans]|uniref:Cytochrome c-type biogenesis protein n=1 Tax=Tropicibacter naphthalenivorans TaxID=441103 RepID=A0A0P1G522_9RHOB|nr:cytochrome c-type biogenesis protein [Tropicibacter naphthalenivorans]CUH76856.1 Cytochrome c-type biogenesis protein CcmH precursor [Tropicibacter naphthalenivorans]SMC62640.1 cytochrome c-type biogenesis protein CcmH [Tropicibacter naphthalenivorans]
MRLIKTLAVVASLALPGAALAVQPDEMLADPAEEARAREISAGLRCLVCQNESIDESNASLARDLRILVRERITAGDTNEEAVDYIVARYGEFVLLRPTTGGWNWLLWGAGPLMFILALGLGIVYVGRRSKADAPTEAGLSDDERKRLEEILKS